MTIMQNDTFTANDGTEATAILKKGKWTEDEDEKLRRAVMEYGIENWVAIEKYSGLARQSKSCRLRWINHLRPNLKKGPFGEDEERIIVKLHHKYGNRWSRIASKLPGRTDNEIKNFWHKRVKKCKKHHRPIYPAAYIDDDQIPDQDEASILLSNNMPRPFTSSPCVQQNYHNSTQVSSLMQQDVASNTHTQILSSANEQSGGFQTLTSQLSPWDHFVASSTIETPQALRHISSLSSLQVSSSITTSTTHVPPLNMQSPNSMTSLSGPQIEDFHFQSNLSGPLTPSPSAPTLSYPNLEPVSLSLDLQPIQPSPLNSSLCVKTEHPSIQFSSPQKHGLYKVRSDGNLEVITARKEAQAKARIRRKTLRLNRISNKRDSLHEYSSNSSTRPFSPNSSSRTEPIDVKSLMINASSKNLNDTLDPTQLLADDFVCEFASREEPSSKNMDIFYSQDSFLMEDLFGQSQLPVFDTFGPLYSQSTATTLLNTEFTESLDRNFIEEQNLQNNGKILELNEQNLLYHQYPTANLMESGCVMAEPSMESELQEGRSGSGSGSGTESSLGKILKREYSWDQSLCTERLMATHEQNPLMNGVVPGVNQSSITHLLGYNTWNEESCEFPKHVT